MSEPPTAALDVFEDAETGNRFVPYVSRQGVELDCLFDGEQPWFTMVDLAAIVGVTVPTIRAHSQRLTADGELDGSTKRDSNVVRREGNREVNRPITHYGLDVAFYVGHRVCSSEGKLFRRWATSMLVQLATKGFVVQVRRPHAIVCFSARTRAADAAMPASVSRPSAIASVTQASMSMGNLLL